MVGRREQGHHLVQMASEQMLNGTCFDETYKQLFEESFGKANQQLFEGRKDFALHLFGFLKRQYPIKLFRSSEKMIQIGQIYIDLMHQGVDAAVEIKELVFKIKKLNQQSAINLWHLFINQSVNCNQRVV